MEGLPGWVISPMPGPPPRQHKHERQYTPSTHSFIPTRRTWNDDDDGQMVFGDLGGLKFPDISLTGEEKPRKNLTRPGVEAGPAAWQARMLPHAPQRWTKWKSTLCKIVLDNWRVKTPFMQVATIYATEGAIIYESSCKTKVVADRWQRDRFVTSEVLNAKVR